MAGIFLVCFILCSVIEVFLFLLYNEKFHPFKNIIININNKDADTISLKDMAEDQIVDKNDE